jgi:multicomponent K+:H+ antiporter subunit A
MGKGPLLKTVTTLMLPFIVVLVIFLLFNGHNRAGGGFIAGVLASGAIILQFIASGKSSQPKILNLIFRWILVSGLALSIGVGLTAILFGSPFLTSFHSSIDINRMDVHLEFSLAQIFDVGIFLLIVGGIMTAVSAINREY